MNTLDSQMALQNETAVGTFFAQVYKWMTLAMIVTAAVAWFTAQWAGFQGFLATNPLAFWGIVIAELALVFVLAGRAHKLSPAAAVGLFMLYSALSGLTLSMIFLVYASTDIFTAFVVTAAMFGAMSLFGYTTKRDLSGLGSFFLMAIIGLIIASVINIWLGSGMIDWMVTYGGVVIFAGLAAYDHQKLKAYALAGHDSTGMAVNGALTLYLDFVNLFLSLLRVFGRE